MLVEWFHHINNIEMWNLLLVNNISKKKTDTNGYVTHIHLYTLQFNYSMELSVARKFDDGIEVKVQKLKNKTIERHDLMTLG